MRPNRLRALVLLGCLAAWPSAGSAQDIGSLDPKPLAPLAHPENPATPAKELFGRRPRPAALPPRAIGFYSKGCLAGGEALPIDGPTWQVMRLSRNRNWGHPAMVAFLKRVSAKLPAEAGWPGLLVGDMSQPRGGPMITGHASHQIGLDADIWFTPMPGHRLSRTDREEMAATNLVREDRTDIDPEVYRPQDMRVVRAFAEEPEVERIFVNPAIKRAFCRDAGRDRGWLAKVRPLWGHNYHFHVRIACPAGETACHEQDPVPGTEQCGADLDKWFTPEMLFPRPGAPAAPLVMGQLPPDCRRVLAAP